MPRAELLPLESDLHTILHPFIYRSHFAVEASGRESLFGLDGDKKVFRVVGLEGRRSTVYRIKGWAGHN